MASNYGRAEFNNRQPQNNLQYQGRQPLLEMPLSGDMQDVQKAWLFDTARFLKGVEVKPQIIKLFKAPIGSQANFINVPTVSYIKTEADTSMETANFLSGQAFDIANIQACTSRRFGNLSAPDEALRVAQAALNTAGAVALAGQIELVEHLAETVTLASNYGGSGKTREQGLLKFFPTGYGQSVSTGGTSYVKSNNGFGRAHNLLNVRRLGDKVNIDVELHILEAFIPNIDCQIQVIHDGLLYRSVA
jgi:hypothetical protein